MATEPLANKLAEIQRTTIDLTEVIKSLAINSDEDQKNAVEIGLQIKARLKRIEELRLFFVADLTKKVNEINKEFRTAKQPLEQMLSQVDSVICEWRNRERARIEAERKKEEAKQRKAFEKEQEKIAKQAEKQAEIERQRLASLELSKKEQKAELQRIESEKLEKISDSKADGFSFDNSDFQQSKTVHSDVGSATFKTVLDFEVIDPVLVPREYTQIDLVAIRKAIKDGVRNISGVKIFEREVVNRKL